MRSALAGSDVDLAEGITSAVAPSMPISQYALVSVRARCLENREEHDAAAVGFADAATRWRAFGMPYEEAQALLGQGRCLLALGRAQEAAAALTAAREIFARLGAKPALAETDELMQQVASA